MRYVIHANPLNPVQYLACCGVFEILSRFDANAMGWWESEPQSGFWLESVIDEASVLTCLKDAFAGWAQCRSSAEDDRNDEALGSEGAGRGATEPDGEDEEANESILLCYKFSLNDKEIPLCMDWWYETLTPEKKIKEKGAWKMYAGQQTAEKIFRSMTGVAAQLLEKQSAGSLTDLINLSAGMTGRFGFDPRSSRNALDAGYSANDLKLPIATYPFAELLATVAAQHFFPQRNQQGGGITSSRGWIKNDLFRCALWKAPLPITLARMSAAGVAVNKGDVTLLQVKRASRDKYSNFRMATATVPEADD